jgi:hypothetical protein
MQARHRSRLGALLGLFMLPALLGVMACFELPAPVGNPERSRIDPALNGVWLDGDEDEGWMFIFEPYDKRTWLVRWVLLEASDDDADDSDADDSPGPAEGGEIDEESGNVEATEPSAFDLLHAGTLEPQGSYLIKAWRKRIGRVWFMTFEFRGMIDDETGMDPYAWWVMKPELMDENTLSLQFVNQELEGIEEGMTRAQLERLIRRNLDNPELFDGALVLRRVPQDDFEVLAEMLGELGVGPDYYDLYP